MDTKQSPTKLGLSFGEIDCLEVFATHFNPNNSLLFYNDSLFCPSLKYQTDPT